jgi:hypothetical protein
LDTSILDIDRGRRSEGLDKKKKRRLMYTSIHILSGTMNLGEIVRYARNSMKRGKWLLS